MILHYSIFSHHSNRLTSHDPTIVPNCTIAAEQLRPPYSFHTTTKLNYIRQRSSQSNQRCCGRLVQVLDTVVGRLSTKICSILGTPRSPPILSQSCKTTVHEGVSLPAVTVKPYDCSKLRCSICSYLSVQCRVSMAFLELYDVQRGAKLKYLRPQITK
jgi:hypothetical protein